MPRFNPEDYNLQSIHSGRGGVYECRSWDDSEYIVIRVQNSNGQGGFGQDYRPNVWRVFKEGLKIPIRKVTAHECFDAILKLEKYVKGSFRDGSMDPVEYVEKTSFGKYISIEKQNRVHYKLTSKVDNTVISIRDTKQRDMMSIDWTDKRWRGKYRGNGKELFSKDLFTILIKVANREKEKQQRLYAKAKAAKEQLYADAGINRMDKRHVSLESYNRQDAELTMKLMEHQHQIDEADRLAYMQTLVRTIGQCTARMYQAGLAAKITTDAMANHHDSFERFYRACCCNNFSGIVARQQVVPPEDIVSSYRFDIESEQETPMSIYGVVNHRPETDEEKRKRVVNKNKPQFEAWLKGKQIWCKILDAEPDPIWVLKANPNWTLDRCIYVVDGELSEYKRAIIDGLTVEQRCVCGGPSCKGTWDEITLDSVREHRNLRYRIVPKWYQDLNGRASKGVICKVYDNEEGGKDHIFRMIVKYDTERSLNFTAVDGIGWKYAEPIGLDDLMAFQK